MSTLVNDLREVQMILVKTMPDTGSRLRQALEIVDRILDELDPPEVC